MIRKIRDRIRYYKAKKDDKDRTKIIEKFFELWDSLHKNKKYHADNFMNACIYILLVNRDIFYLYSLYYFEKSDSKKNFHGRILSMTIYEYLLEINHILGNDMIKEITKNKWDPALIDDLKGISKLYSTVKKTFDKELKETRNNAAAHKTKDTRKLYQLTKKEFDYLERVCHVLRIIELKFDRFSMKFDLAEPN
jgi:hypothetical protein